MVQDVKMLPELFPPKVARLCRSPVICEQSSSSCNCKRRWVVREEPVSPTTVQPRRVEGCTFLKDIAVFFFVGFNEKDNQTQSTKTLAVCTRGALDSRHCATINILLVRRWLRLCVWDGSVL